MKRNFVFLLLLFVGKAIGQNMPETYTADPASVEKAGVPKGEIIRFTFENSKIFPGTTREVTIYIPARYDGKKACLCIYKSGWCSVESSNRL